MSIICVGILALCANSGPFIDPAPGEETDQRSIRSWPRAPADYPVQVPIGCGHDAVFYSLMMMSKRGWVARIEDGDAFPDLLNEKESPYDAAYRVRWAHEKELEGELAYYFFFRRGFLVARCSLPPGENLSLKQVYEREILSGLQHPPNYPGLLAKATWGPPSGFRYISIKDRNAHKPDRATGGEEIHSPKLRCGIAVDGLPPFAVPSRLNVVVIVQHVEGEELTLGIPYKWVEGVFGTIGLAAFRRESKEMEEPLIVGDNVPLRLASGHTGKFLPSHTFLAPIHLERNQCIWFWYQSTVFGDPRLVLRAKVALFGVDGQNLAREYRLDCEIPSERVRDPQFPKK